MKNNCTNNLAALDQVLRHYYVFAHWKVLQMEKAVTILLIIMKKYVFTCENCILFCPCPAKLYRIHPPLTRTTSGHNLNRRTVSGHNWNRKTVSGHNLNRKTVSSHNLSRKTVSGHNLNRKTVSGHNLNRQTVSGHNLNRQTVM